MRCSNQSVCQGNRCRNGKGNQVGVDVCLLLLWLRRIEWLLGICFNFVMCVLLKCNRNTRRCRVTVCSLGEFEPSWANPVFW